MEERCQKYNPINSGQTTLLAWKSRVLEHLNYVLKDFMFDVVFFILVLRFFFSIALAELEVIDCLTSI